MSNTILHESKYLRVVERDGWQFAERPDILGVVIIAAVTAERRLLLVEQHRIPVGASVIEMPAGLVGDEPGRSHESLEEAAERELFEETGYRAEHFVRLMQGPPSAGMTNEIITFVQAEDLRREGPGGGDASERITVHEIPLADVRQWLQQAQENGRLVDPKIYAGLYLMR